MAAASRLVNLDVLRGAAVALVLARHMPIAPGPDEDWIAGIFHAGWTGVDLFFVLSGFLIWLVPYVNQLPALLRQHLVDSVWMDRSRFWLLSIATGYFASRWIEHPFLAQRSRWLPVDFARKEQDAATAAPLPNPAQLLPGAR